MCVSRTSLTAGNWTPIGRLCRTWHQALDGKKRGSMWICGQITASSCVLGIWVLELLLLKPRSHCADHSLPMFPIIADRPDLSWSWQNHQIVAITPDLCLSKTACTILVRQLYDTGTTEVFDPLLVRFRRPLVRPLIRSTLRHSRCWRPHPRSSRFATTIKTT